MGEETLPPVMTVAELAKYAGLQELVVRRLARDGTIPALKLGRQWRIKRDLLERWMKERSVEDLGDLVHKP
jgi:PTS system nitrogen regulatory IIA component